MKDLLSHSTTLKQKIQESIEAFRTGSTKENALNLLGVLGYRTNKTLSLKTRTPASFCETFDSHQKLNKQKAFLDEWKTVEFLSQFADDDVNSTVANQPALFDSSCTYNGSIIQSYLFFVIELRHGQYPRGDLASITREVNKLFKMSVVILFRPAESLTFAIIHRRLHRRDPDKDVLEKVTQIKDIKIKNPHRAHIDILAKLALSSLLASHPFSNFAELQKAWEKVLSTKELNEEFYKDIAAWYYWAVSTIKLPVVADYLAGREKADEENVKNFAIRLVCRTVFCWFLKERGLIDEKLLEMYDPADNPRFPVNPNVSLKFPDENSYYRGILQNIFFSCLNTPMNYPKGRRRSAKEASYDNTVSGKELKKLAYLGKNYLAEAFDYGLLDRIPYLNGGLFDVLPEDNASDTIDDANIYIPNKLFTARKDDAYEIGTGRNARKVEGLNVILSHYKFTITENTPLDEEVALDPELLGLVFENLLAEVDTRDESASKSARKASGSYYTPRKVITYMVNESLHLYLENFLQQQNVPESDIAALNDLIYYDRFDEKNRSLANAVVSAFDKIRILDPACGSGAFPMGALHRILTLLKLVDPENKRWLHLQLARIPDVILRKRAEDVLARHTDDYSRKLGLIEHAIYGVDNQPLAALLSKLRFFIALLIDQNIDLNNAADNYDITPLPNLETKMICADSLRDLQPKLWDEHFFEEIKNAREEYYQPTTTSDRREALAEEIAEKMAHLYPDFAQQVSGTTYDDPTTHYIKNKEYLKEWFRHSTICAPFFNFELFFPELQGTGFDIVIGNPPYGGTGISNKLKETLDLGSKDPYGAFISRFVGDGTRNTPLKNKGILAYIVSDTFMTIKTHRKLRLQMMNNYIHKMIRVNGDTFKATVNTVIILCQKNKWPDKMPQDKRMIGNRHHCQMVDLTNVSIHDNYERFLKLLLDTKGFGKRKNITTESCAVYYYPQTLIHINSNLPFFVASPKLFALMNDQTSPVVFKEINGKKVRIRTIEMNGKQIELTKLDQIAEVKQGLATGDNDAYLFQNPNARGKYRDISQYRAFLLTGMDLERIQSNEHLRLEVIGKGISKDNPKSKRYFGGRYIIPYDKGGESEAEEGWIPNYYVPTDYFIDWSVWAVDRMKTLTTKERNKQMGKGGGDNRLCSRFQNVGSYFLPGITFSPTGFYAHTFRVHRPSVYDKEGSCIFSGTHDVEELLGFFGSRITKYFQKCHVNGTVHSMQGDIKEVVIPLEFRRRDRLMRLIHNVIEKQKQYPRYDYANCEQIEIDHLVYEAYGLSKYDIAEVETWYARRYPKLVTAQRRNLRKTRKLPKFQHFNLYCDESCHLIFDRQPAMVLGALQCPRDKARQFSLDIRKIKRDHGLADGFEIKWTKVSPAKLDFYINVLDFFFKTSELRFLTRVVHKPPPPDHDPKDHDAIVESLMRHDEWYYEHYFELLKDSFNPLDRYHIYIDIKDTRGGERISRLRARLSDVHYDFTSQIVQKLQLVSSKESNLSQVADLLIGAVSHSNRPSVRRNQSAKKKLIKFIEERAQISLSRESPSRDNKIVLEWARAEAEG